MKLALQRTDLVLGAIMGVLAAIIAYEYAAPLPAFDLPNVSAPPPSPIPDVRPYMAPPQAQFSAIDARPIFNPLRQPVESTATAGSKVSAKPPEAVLVGIILDSKNQLALIKAEGAPFATSVGVGGAVEGWEITEITSDHVILKAGAQEYTLRMDAKRAQQPSMPNATGGDRTTPAQTSAPQFTTTRRQRPEQRDDPAQQGSQDHNVGGK